MLEAFIRLYYDEMYEEWGPDDEEESKEYWPEISSPADLVKCAGTNVLIYALEDAIYAKSKTGSPDLLKLTATLLIVFGWIDSAAVVVWKEKDWSVQNAKY